MDNERYKQILTSIIVSVALFLTGFYIGQNNNGYKKSINSLSGESGVLVDMEPFWKVWDILDEKFTGASSTTEPISNKEKMWGAIQGLASSYGDPYTVFFPPVESTAFEEEISGSFGGVGMEIGIDGGFLTVIAPLKNTPAYRAGVLAGDKIVEIDGKSALNLSTDEAIGFIRGKSGTTVSITFVRDGEKEPLVKNIIRANIEIPTVNTKITPEGVFVIELYNFSATSPNLFRNALREFIESNSRMLVLDLRNNPGGYLEASIDMASWFLPTGKTIVVEDFGGKKENKVYRSKGYNIFNKNLKMAILINEGSASASEILAGALNEHGVATLVGRKTFGKGSVQELVSVTGDTSLKVTVAHWLTPLGKSISEGGLEPDVVVERNNNEGGENDPILQKAVQFLTSSR